MKLESLAFVALAAALLASCVVYAANYESLSYSQLYKAENAMNRLEANNVKSDKVTDLVNEAKLTLSLKKFELSLNASSAAIVIAELAENTSFLYAEDLLLIEAGKRVGINTSDEQSLMDAYPAEFARSHFEEAHGLALEVFRRLERKISKSYGYLSHFLAEINANAKEAGIVSMRLNSSTAQFLSKQDAKQIVHFYDEIRLINRTITCLIDQKNSIRQLQDKMMTPMFNQLLEEGLALLEAGEYEKTLEVCSQGRKLSEGALKAYHEFADLSQKIEDAEEKKIKVDEPRKISIQAEEKLNHNQVEQARQLIKQGLDLLEQQIADDTLFKVVSKSQLSFSLRSVLLRHWLLLIVMSLIISCAAVVSYHGFMAWNKKRVHKNLVENESVLNELMKKAQKKYFIDKKMTRESYESQMDSYQLRLVSLREKLSAFQVREIQERKKSKPSWIKLKVIKILKFLLIKLIEYEQKERFKSK